MSGKKNLHEGNILYFGLKVCKKTGTKKVRQWIPRRYTRRSTTQEDQHQRTTCS